MCFKSPLCQVVWLVITVMLHSATAQLNSLSIEALVDRKLAVFKQTITEQCQTHNKEVNEKQADSVNRLIIIIHHLLAGQLESRKQLESARKELNHIINPNVSSSCTTLNVNNTGTYYIRPAGAVGPFLVRCDFEDNFDLGGGWTVFQHRYDGSVDFYRNWTMYKDGFGDENAEHWLGLEKLHLMTKSGKHELLIIMEDFDGNTAYAHYKDFEIGNEDEKYELTIGNYSGTAGDSLQQHNGMKFTTFDQDNDTLETSNCAELRRGGWWFYACYYSHLNGVYHKKGKHSIGYYGVDWLKWKGIGYSLKSTKMMLRRRSG